MGKNVKMAGKATLRINSLMPFCNYPLVLDTYKGCPHGCVYCFAIISYNWNNTNKTPYEVARPLDYKKAIEMINGTYEHAERKSNRLINHFLKLKQPIHIGGMADPFPKGIEEKLGHTKKFIEQIEDYPIIWSTKNPIKEYAELMKDGNHVMQCSIIGFGEMYNRIEPYCPTPEERIEQLKEYRGKAKKIIIRLQPYIPHIHTKKTMSEYMKKISEVADAVTLESLKISVNSEFKELSNITGIDIAKDMKKSGVRNGKDFIVPDNIKKEYIQMARELAKENGLEFYAADNALRDYGDCGQCCGISKHDPKIWQSKMNYNNSELVFALKEKRKIKVKDVIEAMPEIYKTTKLAELDWNNKDKKGTLQAKTETIAENLITKMTTKNYRNPAVMMMNIGLKRLDDGELYFVYLGD